MIKASDCKGDQRTAATIRTISPHDFELERQFIESLSPTTGYRRLLSPRRPTDERSGDSQESTHPENSR